MVLVKPPRARTVCLEFGRLGFFEKRFVSLDVNLIIGKVFFWPYLGAREDGHLECHESNLA